MHCFAQDGRLPLHYATGRGATLEVVVVKLLLGPEGSGKATAIATDKARRSANTTACAATAPRPHMCSLCSPLAALAAGCLGRGFAACASPHVGGARGEAS
eukprot:scaffold42929_cov69-Phaeocystis_antarctica.AAC.3